MPPLFFELPDMRMRKIIGGFALPAQERVTFSCPFWSEERNSYSMPTFNDSFTAQGAGKKEYAQRGSCFHRDAISNVDRYKASLKGRPLCAA